MPVNTFLSAVAQCRFEKLARKQFPVMQDNIVNSDLKNVCTALLLGESNVIESSVIWLLEFLCY
jgi:hypothetical protein